MRGDGAGGVDGLAKAGGEEVLRRSHGRGGQHGDGEDAGKLEYGIKVDCLAAPTSAQAQATYEPPIHSVSYIRDGL